MPDNRNGGISMHPKTNLYEAHRQWAKRPADQRFPNLEALYEFTLSRKHSASEGLTSLGDVTLQAKPDGGITINSSMPESYLTHWSFGQLCSRAGVPAGFLRTLSPELAVDCLNFSLGKTELEGKILLREPNVVNANYSQRLAAAFTSANYGRIWDVDVVSSIQEAVRGTAWHTPFADSTEGSENAGLYASDRDMFVFLINDANPIEIEDTRLYRGFFCWNSETGASTFGLTTFLYNCICGNHIVWGAEQVSELRIVHRQKAVNRFYREAIPVITEFVESRSQNDRITDVLFRAMHTPVGNNPEEVKKWFKPRNFTRNEVSLAWKTGLAEGNDVGTLWGMLQGFTADARQKANASDRVDLERRAGRLLEAAT